MKKFLPILSWLPTYKKTDLRYDLAAGLTVGIMLIPQGMAYAMIAGLPPVYGLYAAMVPQVIYAIFGTSRQLAVGAVAMDSLLVAAALVVISDVGSDQYIALAILLAFMVGSVQLFLGVLRMGFMVNFLSKPVISGFTFAAALIIGIGQLKNLLGIEIERSNNIFKILYEATQHWSAIHIITLAIGISGIIILKYIKRLHKSIPGALVAVILSILLVKFLELDEAGVQIIGTIPQGLPQFAVPDINSEYFYQLIPAALSLALIAFLEAISIAKALQAKHKGEYEIDANQELIGLGLGNVIGSLFGSFPTTAGFGRSAVNDQAGAKTNLAAIISASLVALTLLFLTPLFFYLPKSILASIIIVAVYGLIDINYPKYLWRTRKEDFIMFLISFIVTLSFGIKEGIGISVVFSLIAVIYRSTTPHYAVLGRFTDSNVFRNIVRFPNLIVRDDILIIRYDADLYFANTSHFIDSLKKEINKKGDSLKLVILQANTIANIDSTAYMALTELITELEQRNIKFYFSNLIGPSRDFLTKSGINLIGDKVKSFVDIDTSIRYFDEHFGSAS